MANQTTRSDFDAAMDNLKNARRYGMVPHQEDVCRATIRAYVDLLEERLDRAERSYREFVVAVSKMDFHAEREYAKARSGTMREAAENLKLAGTSLVTGLLKIIKPWMLVAYFIVVGVLLAVDVLTR